MKDGDQPYVVRVGPITMSQDPNYVGVPAQDLNVLNVDDDSAGITVTPTSGLQTNESGGTATFTVVLNTAPLGGTVTVPFTSSDPSEGTVTASVTFNAMDWNMPHPVTITGVNDNPPVQDGNATYTITVGPVHSEHRHQLQRRHWGNGQRDQHRQRHRGHPRFAQRHYDERARRATDSFTVRLATVPAGTVTVLLSDPGQEAR